MTNTTLFQGNAVIRLYRHDLPDGLDLGKLVAIDTETMGLNPHRDRLCLVQLSSGDGNAHLVQLIPESLGGHGYAAPNLKALLVNPDCVKLFHFARFDCAALYRWLGVRVAPVACTKVAAKLVRTFTDRHGLKELLAQMVGVDVSKQQQSSDWGAPELSSDQQTYAASDVLHLHALWARLEALLLREGRMGLAQDLFRFLPAWGELDLLGYDDPDILSH